MYQHVDIVHDSFHKSWELIRRNHAAPRSISACTSPEGPNVAYRPGFACSFGEDDDKALNFWGTQYLDTMRSVDTCR